MKTPKEPSAESKKLGHYLALAARGGDDEADEIGDALVALAVQRVFERIAENLEKGADVSRAKLAAYHARVDATPEKGPDFYRPGRHALMAQSFMLPPCGCSIVGGGSLPDPIRIVFCTLHRGVRS